MLESLILWKMTKHEHKISCKNSSFNTGSASKVPWPCNRELEFKNAWGESWQILCAVSNSWHLLIYSDRLMYLYYNIYYKKPIVDQYDVTFHLHEPFNPSIKSKLMVCKITSTALMSRQNSIKRHWITLCKLFQKRTGWARRMSFASSPSYFTIPPSSGRNCEW